MKRIILFLILINFFSVSNSQIIRGTILDKTNNNNISFASIYINGSYVGTNSDQNGYFELALTNSHSLPLTISALGYYSVTLTEYSTDKPLVVFLTPKVFEMKQVVVEARSLAKERKNNLKLIRNEFLGITGNAQRCAIINENDIRFNYGSSDDTLKAFASKPIIIYNNGLGYKITYYLDKFEYYKKSKSFLYKGSALFNEDFTSDVTKKKFFERRRKYAYLGSRSQFFNSLWTNKLKSNGFFIKNSSNETLNYEDIVIEKDSLKKYLVYDSRVKYLSKIPRKAINLKSDNNLEIYYLSKTPNSNIEFLKDTVFFNNTGYFDGSGVRILGLMAKQRIGDLLPYGYNPILSPQDTSELGQFTKNQNHSSPLIMPRPDSLEEFVQLHQEHPAEKIFLHVDRSDYMNGDTIWFKAYLWYGYDQLPDTISGILYVDLINAEGKVTLKRKLLIHNGTSHGDFCIDSTIVPGLYTLRAYTRLMTDINTYDKFYQTIRISPVKQKFQFECIPVILKEIKNDSLKIGFRFFETDTADNLHNDIKHKISYSFKIGDKLIHKDSILAENIRENVLRYGLEGLSKHDSVAEIGFSITDKGLSFEKQFTIPLYENIDLQFFPEGGNLVAGLESKVAFKAVGIDGLGREVKGEITTSDEKIITGLKSTNKGMGYFMLRPEPTKQYFANLWHNNQKYIVPLPHVSENGSVMSLIFNRDNKDAILSIKQTQTATLTQKYLTGSAYGKIWFSALVKSFKDSCGLKIPLELLPEGICRLTLLNENFEPECERLIYVDKKQRFKIEVIPDSSTYATRSKVTLLVKTTDLDNSPVQTNLSMSVLDKGQIENNSGLHCISAYKLLESELRGNIEEPDTYFKDDSCVNQGAMDLLLLTQGYRKFLPNLIDTSKVKYQPEKNFFVSGKIKLNGTKSQVSRFNYNTVDMTLISISKEPYVGLSKPDSLGNYRFKLPLIKGKPTLILQATTSKKKPFNGEIVMDKPVPLPKFNTRPNIDDILPAPIFEAANHIKTIIKSGNSGFKLPGTMSKSLGEVIVTAKVEPKNWWHVSDKDAIRIVSLDSLDPSGKMYKNFYDLLIQEFGAQPYTQGDLTTILLPAINMDYPRNHWISPIYLIDGNIYHYDGPDFSALNTLSSFPVNEIKRIMIIPPGRGIAVHYGQGVVAGGIYQSMVVIETYHKNTYRGDLPGVKKFILDGLDAPREFYSPRYEGLSRNRPEYDGRITLFWEPEINTDVNGEASVEFYTNDRKASLEIIINGIEIENGNPGEENAQINLN